MSLSRGVLESPAHSLQQQHHQHGGGGNSSSKERCGYDGLLHDHHAA
jgi:hypothetical protein